MITKCFKMVDTRISINNLSINFFQLINDMLDIILSYIYIDNKFSKLLIYRNQIKNK